jgi:hypothetical protein
VLANAVNEKNRFLIPKKMMKNWQKTGFPGTKKRTIGQKITFFQKISKHDGFNKFFAHISPIFDDSSDSPGQKKHLGQPDSIF